MTDDNGTGDDHASGEADPGGALAPAESSPPDVEIRLAAPVDLPAVAGVLDAAMLTVDRDRIRRAMGIEPADGRAPDETVLVADADGGVVGALVLDGNEISAVAVRPGRRDRGIGTALVGAAAERTERLVAGFDARVLGFYESLGFAVERVGEDRYRGVRES